jgi:hypothetical protein
MEYTAKQLKKVLDEQKLDTLFVATDGTPEGTNAVWSHHNRTWFSGPDKQEI